MKQNVKKRRKAKRGWKKLFLVCACIIFVYALLIKIISIFSSQGFNSVKIDVYGGLAISVLKIASLILGYAIVYVVPGTLWLANKNLKVNELLIKSFIISILLYALFFSALKLIFRLELTRSLMLFSAAIFVGAAYIKNRRNQFKFAVAPAGKKGFVVAGLLVLFLVLAFNQKIFLENFSGDGIENFEFSKSLKTRIFPYWDLENGYWGFHPTHMFYAYPNILSILHVGESEAAVRLPFFVFLFFVYLLMVGLIKHKNKKNLTGGLMVVLPIFLFTSFNIFYSGRHPHFSDIAAPSGLNLMMTFFFLASTYFFLKKEKGWFLVCSFLASLIHINGVVLVGLLFFSSFLFNKNKRFVIRYAKSFIIIFLIYLVAIKFYSYFFPFGATQYSINSILARFSWESFSVFGVFRELGYLLLMVGGLPVLLFPFLKNKDRLSIQIYLISVLYVLAVFVYRKSNLHYFAPIALLFVVSFLRCINLAGKKPSFYLKLSYIGVIILFVLFTFPFNYAINQNARKLGKQTCFDAINYKKQVEMSEIIYERLPFSEYGIGHHTLVYYSDKGGCFKAKYNYIFTEKSPSLAGFDKISKGGINLFIKKDSK